MTDVIAQHNVGGGNLKKVYGSIQECQTFKLTSNITTARKCLYIRHRDAGKQGTLGNITIAIYDVGGVGKPTGPALGTVTIASTNWSGILGIQNPMEDAGVEFSDCTLQPSTPYALVISAADGNSSNYIYWYSNTGGYSDGESFISTDGGGTWVAFAGEDFGFQIFGEPLPPGKAQNPTPTDNQEDIKITGKDQLKKLQWEAPD